MEFNAQYFLSIFLGRGGFLRLGIDSMLYFSMQVKKTGDFDLACNNVKINFKSSGVISGKPVHEQCQIHS